MGKVEVWPDGTEMWASEDDGGHLQIGVLRPDGAHWVCRFGIWTETSTVEMYRQAVELAKASAVRHFALLDGSADN